MCTAAIYGLRYTCRYNIGTTDPDPQIFRNFQIFITRNLFEHLSDTSHICFEFNLTKYHSLIPVLPPHKQFIEQTPTPRVSEKTLSITTERVLDSDPVFPDPDQAFLRSGYNNHLWHNQQEREKNQEYCRSRSKSGIRSRSRSRSRIRRTYIISTYMYNVDHI